MLCGAGGCGRKRRGGGMVEEEEEEEEVRPTLGSEEREQVL